LARTGKADTGSLSAALKLAIELSSSHTRNAGS
jgi:4-hydroxy-L-threonine phosphate dehydrogenase PdxA